MQTAQPSRPFDLHSRLTEAKAALDGVRGLCASASEEKLSYVTGFALDMLLLPISRTLEECLKPTPTLQPRNAQAGVP